MLCLIAVWHTKCSCQFADQEQLALILITKFEHAQKHEIMTRYSVGNEQDKHALSVHDLLVFSAAACVIKTTQYIHSHVLLCMVPIVTEISNMYPCT